MALFSLIHVDLNTTFIYTFWVTLPGLHRYYVTFTVTYLHRCPSFYCLHLHVTLVTYFPRAPRYLRSRARHTLPTTPPPVDSHTTVATTFLHSTCSWEFALIVILPSLPSDFPVYTSHLLLDAIWRFAWFILHFIGLFSRDLGYLGTLRFSHARPGYVFTHTYGFHIHTDFTHYVFWLRSSWVDFFTFWNSDFVHFAFCYTFTCSSTPACFTYILFHWVVPVSDFRRRHTSSLSPLCHHFCPLPLCLPCTPATPGNFTTFCTFSLPHCPCTFTHRVLF